VVRQNQVKEDESKNKDTILMSIFSPNIDRQQNSYSGILCRKFRTKWSHYSMI